MPVLRYRDPETGEIKTVGAPVVDEPIAKQHINNKDNPHETTLSQLGVNVSANEINSLEGVTSNIQEQLDNISDTFINDLQDQLNAKVPVTRKINNKALSTDITLTASDVGAATESYVDNKVASLVDSAPGTLDTLNELAAALGDDPNFATTVATEIGKKVDKVEGKGLSTNDFTTEEKNKLAGIAANANNYIHPSTHAVSMITGLATVATSGSYNDLSNKPTIPAAVTVDSALSSTSTNPVQNKVINDALAGKAPAGNYAGSSSAGGAATSVNVTNTTPTAATTYYPLYATGVSGTQNVRANADLYYYDAGTWAYLNIGSANQVGGLTLHHSGGYYANLATASLTGNRDITLPDVSGTVITTGNLPTAAQIGALATNGNAVTATTATNATNIYSSASTSKAYILGTTTASSANHATVYNASVYTSGSVLYGAAWNDYAEYRICKEDFKAGQVVCENGDDTLSIAKERLQPGASIVSDTFGFAIGETEDAKCPIAVSGRVLAYPFEDRQEFSAGDAVCAGPNGTVSKMTREEIINYPERIVGTVSAIPEYENWGAGNVIVDNRIWIKIK